MERTVSNEERLNKTALILFTVLTSIIALAYVVQLLKGEAGMGLFMPIIITDLVPMIACWVLFKNNPETGLIKHVMGCGYGLFFIAVCLLTTNTIMVFVYAIPGVLIVSLFLDSKFSALVGVGVSVITLIHAIKFASGRGWEGEAVAEFEIEVLIMVVTSVFSGVINKTIMDINNARVKEINESGARTQQMLGAIMEISNALIEDVSEVSEKMVILADSSDETLSAMQDVTSGTTESANSVQNQLVKTEEIQTQIDNVQKTSESIGTNVSDTVDAIHEGRDNIKKLMDQVRISAESGNSVIKEVEGLKGSTEQMESIVQLIKNVASQTSLLALNASIEAARAGEAGRGFAVVATEISNLAGQTQSATGNISDLIAGISGEMNKVADAVTSLVESNRSQNESAEVTSASFDKIVEAARRIRTDSGELSNIVTKLAKANSEIVESIQTISAVTEEVSAHTTTTCTTTEDNRRTVSEVQKIVDEMQRTADQLKNIEN
ncbi:MAG: hypothetical protein K6E19_00185 [Lachnospiraceae bacterium]|nr:hypothetical protein [Lachnospiraceae bacterium]